MGIIADFFVSSDDAVAIRYDNDSDAFEPDCAHYARITEVELSTLWAILDGIASTPSLMDRFYSVYSMDERAICRLPFELVEGLSRLSGDDLHKITELWAATDEMGWEPKHVLPIVQDLVRLSQLAVKTRRNLYLWNCA